MKLKLKKPLAFIDLETTGVNVSKDHIIEIAIVKHLTNGEEKIFEKRLNPDIPIPIESSLIHGIYDNDVKDAQKFKAVANDIISFLQGCDIAGFNILGFDIPMLVESFLRVDMNFCIENRKMIDSQKIFHLMEKRTLSAAYKFYCEKEMQNAHSALADVRASAEVLEAQLALYDGKFLTDNKGNNLGLFENSIDKLHSIVTGYANMIDFAGRMVYNDKGIPTFNFGKYKDKPVMEVLKKDPGYYGWIIQGDFTLDTKRKLTQIKLQSALSTDVSQHSKKII